MQTKDGDSAAGVVGNAAMIEVNEVMVPLGDDNPLPVSATTEANTTATLSNVSWSDSSVTILASNSSRKWASIYNDSSSVLYIKFWTTASTTSYTAYLVAGAYYEVPFNYTGIITWIWVSATGTARITEITA